MMAKKEMKRLARRSLAMFMTLVMTISMLQLQVFAAESFDDQTMDGYYTVASDGTVETTDATYVEQDGFILKKEIDQTGKDAFNITLTVQTSQTVTTNDAAIQLVIDLSTSMEYCSNCGSSSSYNSNCSAHNKTDRMTEVKKVLTMEGGFLDSLVEANTGAINVSVVTYGLGAYTVALEDESGDQWIDIKDAAALAKVKSAINGLEPTYNATNMQAGLMLARNRLGMKAVENAAVKYTVLLTDGYANTYTQNDSTSTSTIPNGSSPSNANGTTSGKNNAATMANQVKKKSALYAVGYGTDKPYLTDIIGIEKNVYVGSDSAAVAEAFKDIAEKAVIGMNGAGTSVTDPMGTDGGKFTMGQFIVLGNVGHLDGQGVSSTGGTLTWELDPENAEKVTVGDTTTYTYSITYPVTLNTAAEGFEEVYTTDETAEDYNAELAGKTKYYPTNGYTYLSVPQADGSTKPIAFLVPGVCGEIPEYDWTVEYYLEDESSINLKAEDKTYSLDKAENKGKAELHSSVYAPENYDKEYDGYTFAKGDMSTVITADNSKNVIRLYYNLKVAPVTVEHYYKTTTIAPDGTETVGDYVMDPTVRSEFAVIGKTYEAAEQMTFGGVAYDKIDDIKPAKSIRVSETGANNLIQFYYSRVDDQREPTTAQVNHVYTLSVYEVNPETGKYELVEKAPVVEEKVQYSENKLAGQVYSVSAEPKSGYEGYELNPDAGDYKVLAENRMRFVIKPAAGDNVRTLYFEKTEDKRGEPIAISVDHHYTEYVTTVENGVPTPDTITHDVEGEEETWYVGETFQAVEVPEYDGEDYEPAENNYTDKFVLTAADNRRTIDLNYTRTELPNTTEILVNHYFRTITYVTRETTEDITNEDSTTTTVVTGTYVDTVITEDESLYKQTKSRPLYEGQSYTVAPDGAEGYTFNEAFSLELNGLEGWTVYATYPEKLEIDLYYDRTEDRRDASIAVEHIYTTYLTSVVDGEVVTDAERYDGNEVVNYPVDGEDLRAGDTFAATPVTSYGGYEDYVLVGEAPAEITLQAGTNGKIVLNYERSETQLTETTYAVNYEYNVYQMVVNADGTTSYELDTENSWTDSFVPAEGEVFYVGQDVILNAGNKEGFTPASDNPNTQQRLKANGNTWTFVHEQKIDLPQNTVTVNHYYTTTTIAVNGTSSESVREELGTPIVKYVGQTVKADAKIFGEFTLVRSELIYGEVAPAEDAAQTSYNVVVTEQPAVVNFYYEETKNFSVPVTYSVAHEYYLYDWDGSLITATKPAPVTGTGFATNLWVVAPETIEGYELVSATYNGEKLENYNIVLQDSANVVVFRYEQKMARDYVNATVIHNYYKDEAAMKAENAQPEKQYVENVENLPEGSEFSAEQRDAEGYIFRSASPASMKIVVTEGGQNTIIVNYIRATAKYEVVHIYNRNGNEEGRTTETLSGLHGDVIEADEIARVTKYNGKTYTFQSISDDITLDADEIQTITLVYNRKTGGGGGGGSIIIPEPPVIEIPEEDVPLVDIPEVEIPVTDLPEEDIPLADVPKTGETMIYRIMAAISGITLMALAVTGRKKEEEEMA